MADETHPRCSLSYRGKAWLIVGAGLLVFWAVVAWLVFG